MIKLFIKDEHTMVLKNLETGEIIGTLNFTLNLEPDGEEIEPVHVIESKDEKKNVDL